MSPVSREPRRPRSEPLRRTRPPPGRRTRSRRRIRRELLRPPKHDVNEPAPTDVSRSRRLRRRRPAFSASARSNEPKGLGDDRRRSPRARGRRRAGERRRAGRRDSADRSRPPPRRARGPTVALHAAAWEIDGRRRAPIVAERTLRFRPPARRDDPVRRTRAIAPRTAALRSPEPIRRSTNSGPRETENAAAHRWRVPQAGQLTITSASSQRSRDFPGAADLRPRRHRREPRAGAGNVGSARGGGQERPVRSATFGRSVPRRSRRASRRPPRRAGELVLYAIVPPLCVRFS